MSVNSQRCWMLSFFPFLIWIGFYTQIRDTAESPHNRRSSRGATLHGSAKRNANVAVLQRTDAGSSRERTPGSTVFESCLLDMRSWLIATKPWFVLLQQSSVGGKLLLFTDRFLVSRIIRNTINGKSQMMNKSVGTNPSVLSWAEEIFDG
jgi:hypothetical protein